MKVLSTPRIDTSQHVHKQLALLAAQNIEFGSPSTYRTLQSTQNIQGTWATVTTPSGSAEFSVNHDLGRIPSGFLVMNSDQPVEIYSGGTPWTDTQIFLKAAGGAAQVTLFIV